MKSGDGDKNRKLEQETSSASNSLDGLLCHMEHLYLVYVFSDITHIPWLFIVLLLQNSMKKIE